MNMINGVTNFNIGKPFNTEDLINPEIVYFIPSYNCNLHCPHCTIWKRKEEVNYSLLLDIAKQIKNTQICLFGGEIMINDSKFLHKLIDILENNGCTIYASTNLISFDLDVIKRVNVATSFNPGRFSEEQFNLWKNNLKILKNNNISYAILVTLTPSLAKIKPKDFNNLMEEIRLDNVQFDNFIGPLKKEDWNIVDEWLIELYKINKNYDYFNKLESVIDGNSVWGFSCLGKYSVLPNGNLKHGCPYYEKFENKPECLDCGYSDYCIGGCCIQPTCTFPKKLFSFIKENKNG